MGSGQSTTNDFDIGSGSDTLADEVIPAPSKPKITNRRTNDNRKRNKILTNKHEGKLPGEEEDTYNGFFDDIEHTINDARKNDVKDETDKVSIPEEELKTIFDQVDQEITIDEMQYPKVFNSPKHKPIPKLSKKREDNRTKVEEIIEAQKPMKKPRKQKTNENNNNIQNDKRNLDWAYKQESIEGFNLEKFKLANVKIKKIPNGDSKSLEYKVYNVDQLKSSSPVLGVVNKKFSDSHIPKYDFIDERLMSQIESEFS